MNAGYAVLAMAELSRAENAASDARHGVAQANSELVDRWHAHHEKFVFNAKGRVHAVI